MKIVQKFAMVALSSAGLALAAGSAEAQYYPAQPYGGYYYQPQPTYVPPKIARKQEQLNERFIRKYGYVQPQPQYYWNGYGYVQQPVRPPRQVYRQAPPQYYPPQQQYYYPQW